MNQQSMFDVMDYAPEEEKIFQLLRPVLEKRVKEHWMNARRLIFSLRDQRGSQCSAIYLFNENNLLVRICCRKRRWMELPRNNAFSERNLPLGIDYIGKPGSYIRIPLEEQWRDEYTEIILAALDGEFEAYPCDFSCCSSFRECSDARRCVHVDDLFYLGCSYRKSLYNGTVFWGANRVSNLDTLKK